MAGDDDNKQQVGKTTSDPKEQRKDDSGTPMPAGELAEPQTKHGPGDNAEPKVS